MAALAAEMPPPASESKGRLERMLTGRQHADFDDLGFLRVSGAFSTDDAATMRAVAWREMDRKYGIREADRATWTVEWPSGLKNTKRNRAFDAIGGEVLTAAFDQLIGSGEWVRPRTWGQVMVTFPKASQPWVVPHRLWHVDFRYDARPEPLFGLKVFAFFGDVAPRSGGTLVIARSHQLVSRFLADLPEGVRADFRNTRLRFMDHHPWLRALATPEYDRERTTRFVDQDGDVNGIAARVVELTGAAGDVVITHPWTVHHVAVNAGRYPRLMRAQSIYRCTQKKSTDQTRPQLASV
jgi:Phytanoyl-CoA dioxygenase (PhyH)